MARILPPSVFKANFQAAEFKPTMTQRVQERWASPEGVATAVGLLDKVGGTVADAVQSFSREQAAKQKASSEYNEALIRDRLQSISKGTELREPKMSEEDFVAQKLQEQSYETGLKEAAGAKNYAQRRAALAKMLGAYNRLGTGSLLNRFTGKDTDAATTQYKRVIPPLTQAARGIKGKGKGSERRYPISVPALKLAEKQWGQGSKWAPLVAASSLEGLGPDPLSAKSGVRLNNTLWVLDEDRSTHRLRLSEQEEELIRTGAPEQRRALLAKSRNGAAYVVQLHNSRGEWDSEGLRGRLNDVGKAMRILKSNAVYPEFYLNNPEAQMQLRQAQAVLQSTDDSRALENVIATAKRWGQTAYKSPFDSAPQRPIIAGTPAIPSEQPGPVAAGAASPTPAAQPASAPAAAPPAAPPAAQPVAQPALVPPAAPPAAPAQPAPAIPADLDRATDPPSPLDMAKEAGIPSGPEEPPLQGGVSMPQPEPFQTMPPPQQPPMSMPGEGPRTVLPPPPPLSEADKKADESFDPEDLLVPELPAYLKERGFDRMTGKSGEEIIKEFEQWHGMKKSLRLTKDGKMRMPTPKFRKAVERAAKETGVSPEILLGIGFVESANGLVKKTSKKNAMGPFQIIPEKDGGPGGPSLGLKSEADYKNPYKAARAAALYMKRLTKYYATRGPKPDPENAEAIALVAYNYGRGRVNEWLRGLRRVPLEPVKYSNFVLGLRPHWSVKPAEVPGLVPLQAPSEKPARGPSRKPVRRKSEQERAEAAKRRNQQG